MSLKSLTKAQLIEKLENSIKIEKYNKLEKKLQIKNNYINELQEKLSKLTNKMDSLNQEHTQKISEFGQKSDTILNRVKEEYIKLKEDNEYLEDLVSQENDLIQLYREKYKKENEFSDKLYEMYHKILFKENKE